MPELNEFIPAQLLFDSGLKLATVGIVVAKRSDGCHEIFFPQATCILTKNGVPRTKWPKAEGINAAVEFSPHKASSLQIVQPLMPRRNARQSKSREGKDR